MEAVFLPGRKSEAGIDHVGLSTKDMEGLSPQSSAAVLQKI